MNSKICLIGIILFSIHPFAATETEDEFFFRRGMELYRNKQFQFAIEDFEKALKANPNNYRAANMLGKIYRKKKQMKTALDYYLLSLSINPSQADIHYAVGTLYDYFYSSTNSVKHYSKAVELNPTHRYALLKLVRYYLLQKDPLTANRFFEKSYNLGKEKATKFLTEAERAYAEGNELKALERYRKAVKENPAHLDVYFKISEIYLRMKDYQKSVRWLEKVTYIRPDCELAFVRLGNLYYTAPLSKNKKFLFDMAILNLNNALSLNPHNKDALLLLADIYYKSGKLAEAEKLYKKIEEIDNGHN
ncbi:MAG: tetratricopeptide repeat protein [Spirochaetes bacterium]|nr:tetratricopeptide repeat protein [Spirochaetota bacterium]